MTTEKISLVLLALIMASAAAIETHAQSYYVCMSGTWSKTTDIDQYCSFECYTIDSATCTGKTAPAAPALLTSNCGEDSRAKGRKCVVVSAGGTAPPDQPATASGAAGGGESGLKEAGFTKEPCTCQCDGKDINAVGIIKAGFWETQLTDEKATAKGKCWEQCAKTCGGRTTCAKEKEADCETCCADEWCTKYLGSAGTIEEGKKQTEYCKTSCKSTCKFKGTINGITDIIYMIAGVLGALMIAIHGIRMVTSQDPHDRDAAKSSILHVIIALIIIAMAAALVNMFITMGGLDNSSTGAVSSPAPTCMDCKGASCTWEACKAKAGSEGCVYYPTEPLAPNPCVPCSNIGKDCGKYAITPINICAEDPCNIGCEVKQPTMAGGDQYCGKKAPDPGAQSCRDCTGASCTWEQCKTHAGSEGCVYYPTEPLAPNPCIPCSNIGYNCARYAITPINICAEDPCNIGCEVKEPIRAGDSQYCGKI